VEPAFNLLTSPVGTFGARHNVTFGDQPIEVMVVELEKEK
jgi:hypothetical protein